jgi:repressor LexA
MPALTYATRDALTPLEMVVLDHLARGLRSGWCPSREELSQAAGLGGRGYHINSVLESLTTKGYVAVAPGRSRAISLLRTADGRPFRSSTVWVPLLGKMAAGYPLPDNDEMASSGARAQAPAGRWARDAIELTRSLLDGYGQVFALQVTGDSLSDALVDDGDIIVLSVASEAKNGDMVVVRVMGHDGREAVMLKYYYRENGHVRLQPAHPRMPSSLYPANQVAVRGKVVLVIRRTH